MRSPRVAGGPCAGVWCVSYSSHPGCCRHAANALPLAALVSASFCAVGSVRGFDELFPHNPSVVSEYRKYVRVSCLAQGWMGGF